MRWIKCSEKMPEIGQQVLIYFTDKEWGDEYNVAYLVDNYQRAWDAKPRIMFEVSEDSNSYYEVSRITHWMPLPEAPNE